jgi:sterol 14alpha-demethylase
VWRLSKNTSQYISMNNMTIGAVCFTIALVFIAAIIFNKVAIRRTMPNPPRSSRSPPPVVNFAASIGLLHTLFTKGFQEMVFEQCKQLGSVFTVSLVGKKLTFLVGPEVSGQFYQGLDSEVSLNLFKFTVPILGKDVGYSIDSATRYEQSRFWIDALKPTKLRSHVGPMLQEVEVKISNR